jgi:hypothetical protein
LIFRDCMLVGSSRRLGSCTGASLTTVVHMYTVRSPTSLPSLGGSCVFR